MSDERFSLHTVSFHFVLRVHDMKTIIYFENEAVSFHCDLRIIRDLRQQYPEDLIVMISAGDFSSCGIFLFPSSRERSRLYVDAGADLVLSLPAASVLGGFGVKEFAAAALAHNLRISDLQVVIPCVPAPGQAPPDCEKLLRSCSMLMFTEMSGYRDRLKGYLHEMSFRDAQAQTVCDCIPEAEKLLSDPENRYALWLLNSMLQLYYQPKKQFLMVPGSETETDTGSSHNPERAAAASLSDLLSAASWSTLIDISGSSAHMVTTLLERKEQIRSAETLEDITSLLSPVPKDRARLFLLKAILGIRKIQMQICGLHTYVPYCYVLAKDPDKEPFLKHLESCSWVPWIEDPAQEQILKEKYGYLLHFDKKAETLIRPRS